MNILVTQVAFETPAASGPDRLRSALRFLATDNDCEDAKIEQYTINDGLRDRGISTELNIRLTAAGLTPDDLNTMRAHLPVSTSSTWSKESSPRGR